MILRLSILVPLVVLTLRATPVHAVEPIDVNRSTVAELLAVPGMTATWAARIVRFRPYRTKLELLDQGVVTPEVYRRIREGVVAHRVATAH